MFKKVTTRPLPPGAIPLPGGDQARLQDGSLVPLNKNGRMVEESSNWYTRIAGKVVALLPKKKESLDLEAELRTGKRRQDLGIEPEPVRQDEPLAGLVVTWLDELEAAGRHPGHLAKLRGRVGKILEASKSQTVADLVGQDGATKLAGALEGIGGKPGDQIELGKGAEFSPGQIRALLKISSTAMSKLILSRGIVGNGAKGKAKRLTRAEALELIAHRNKPKSAATMNGHRVAILGFCRWLQKQGKLTKLPYLGLGRDESKDRRRVRRTITWDQCKALAKVVEKSSEFMGMSGAARSALYLVAFASLLRARALRELVVGDCHLAGESPFLSIRSETDKTGQARACPLPAEVARALKSLVRGKDKTALVFDLPKQTGAMVRHDLKLAGIAFKTQDGVIDLHAFRGSGATHLAEKGIPLDVVARLGGWRDVSMIYKRYRRYTTQGLADATRGAWQ